MTREYLLRILRAFSIVEESLMLGPEPIFSRGELMISDIINEITRWVIDHRVALEPILA